jgi:hypothetical protein
VPEKSITARPATVEVGDGYLPVGFAMAPAVSDSDSEDTMGSAQFGTGCAIASRPDHPSENAAAPKERCQSLKAAGASNFPNPHLAAIATFPEPLLVLEIERLYQFSRSRFCRGVFMYAWQWLTYQLERKGGK